MIEAVANSASEISPIAFSSERVLRSSRVFVFDVSIEFKCLETNCDSSGVKPRTRRLARPPDAVVLEQLAEAMGALRSTFKRVVCLVFNINYTALSLVKVVLFMLRNSREIVYIRRMFLRNPRFITQPFLYVPGLRRLVTGLAQRLCQAVLICRKTIYLSWGIQLHK